MIEHNHNHPDVLSVLSSLHQLKPEIPDFAPEEIKVDALETNRILVDGICDCGGVLLAQRGT